MKLLKTILFFVWLISSQNLFSQTIYFPPAENSTARLQKAGLKSDSIFLIKKSKNSTDTVLYSNIVYDNYGNKLLEHDFPIYKHPESKKEFILSYHPSGMIEKRQSRSLSINLVQNDEYEYDSLNNEIVHYSYNEDTTNLRIDQKSYNTENKIVALQRKVNNKEYYVYRRYEYDESNRLTRTDSHDPKGNIVYSDILEYKGKRTLTYFENSEGKKLVNASTVDDEGRVIKRTTYKEGLFRSETKNPVYKYESEDTERQYFYYPNGIIREEKLFRNGKMLYTFYHKYQ